MNQFLIMRERVQLKNLHHWLTLAPMSGILVFGAFIMEMAIIIVGLCLLAVGFSVYIIWNLVKLRKKGWIITYAVMIGMPFLVCLIPDETGLAVNALWFIPLALFYFYCWLLRYSVSEWLSDLGDEKAFELGQKSEKQFGDLLNRFR